MENYGISKEKLYIFNNGKDYFAYNTLGCHPYTHNGVQGFRFVVFAPHAKNVFLVSDSLGWDEGLKMDKLDSSGCYITWTNNINLGDVYKYRIETASGKILYKADPYAFYAEQRPATASKVYDIEGFSWDDSEFMNKRENLDHLKQAKNIYEVHLGSWKQHHIEGRDKNSAETPIQAFYSYNELTDTLLPYVEEMGYTHIEVMPLHEFPFDGSWGYQPTGYYAITSRYGEPKDFMHFVNEAHKRGIYVIIDWVPAHFCKDEHGLALFDGEKLYEKKEHVHWGTLTFDFEKSEVKSFLYSNACFFLKEFHIDGIRFDGVSSMLYLNYGIDEPSQKVFNKYGGEGDLAAIDFVKDLNNIIHENFKGVITIAEESTAWPKVTSMDDDGLHFDYKWDMGWMHDTLNYFATDFPYREKNHNFITFSSMYASSEHFILPLSHDEVVHGKCSLVVRQPGDYFRQFAGLRLLYMYQLTHTGGNLNFMGNELAPFIEWKFYDELEWFLLDYDAHKYYNYYVKTLNHLYKNNTEFYQNDYDKKGFRWIEANDAPQHIYIYERENYIIILNMDPMSYPEFNIGVKEEGNYEIVLNSDDAQFGGSGYIKEKIYYKSLNGNMHNEKYYINIQLPGLAGLIIHKIKEN